MGKGVRLPDGGRAAPAFGCRVNWSSSFRSSSQQPLNSEIIRRRRGPLVEVLRAMSVMQIPLVWGWPRVLQESFQLELPSSVQLARAE